MMEKPTQPSQELIELVSIGPIFKIVYDKERSEDSREEARYATHHEGRFEYDCILRLYGRKSGPQLCNPVYADVFITESIFTKYVEAHVDTNNYGFWQVTHEGRVLVEAWEKFLKKEAKDLREYDRLKKKFGRI